jgi:hypothetical protein
MPATSLPLDQVAGVVAHDAVLGICREGVEQCDELLGLREPLGMRVVGANSTRSTGTCLSNEGTSSSVNGVTHTCSWNWSTRRVPEVPCSPGPKRRRNAFIASGTQPTPVSMLATRTPGCRSNRPWAVITTMKSWISRCPLTADTTGS